MKPNCEELRELYNTHHHSSTEVGKVLFYSRHTVLGWLRNCGIERIGNANHKNRPSNATLLRKRYVDGLLLTELAELYKCDVSTVSNWLRSMKC